MPCVFAVSSLRFHSSSVYAIILHATLEINKMMLYL
jgi:hypothetical protein